MKTESQARRLQSFTSILRPLQMLLPGLLGVLTAPSVSAVGEVVIADVYGGGGNAGSYYRCDYIVLHNRTTSGVTVTGWSVQYASATGTSWAVTPLTGTIPAGGYYLIQEACGAGGSQIPLPTPVDATGGISMSGTAGKVALVNSTTPLTGSGCPFSASVVDFVGYGPTANCSEGAAPTPILSNTTEARRLELYEACKDTDINASDFVVVSADSTYPPRNSASPAFVCSGSTDPSGVGAAHPSLVKEEETTLLTVTVVPGANPPSTDLHVMGDLSSIGGSASQTFFDDGSNGDVTPGDNVFSWTATVALGTVPGKKNLPTTITDAQGRMGSAPITLYVPIYTTIGHLRTLQDPVNWTPTDTTNIYVIEGTVTTYTNVTTPANAQFYMQDGPAGIAVFVSGSTTIRPAAGDRMRVTGPLGQFNGLLEMNLAASDPNHSVATISTGNPLPVPMLFQFSYSNDIPSMEYGWEGQLVVVENVCFDRTTSSTFPPAPSGGNVLMTNGLGQLFALRVDGRTDICGQPIPAGASSIVGVMAQFDTDSPFTTGYQLLPTRRQDIVDFVPLQITCPSDITVRATSPAGAVVNYVVSASGGCPPITVIGIPASGSTFPIGTTVVNCTATDFCGQQASCSFNLNVQPQLDKWFYAQNLLPPTNGVFVPPEPGAVILFPGGIILSNIAHGFFNAGFLPPETTGAGFVKSFASQVELDISLDNGLTWQSAVLSNAPVTVAITNQGSSSGDTVYETELTQLDISGGTLPSGVVIRQSQSKSSVGETRIEEVPGGYQIDSFFDIYLEISTDGGGSWQPASSACTVQVKPDPAQVTAVPAPRPVLPMPNGQYLGPGQAYGNGFVVREIRHKLFTGWDVPPHFGGSQTHTFDSKLDFELSTDGGLSFEEVRAPATTTVVIKNVREFRGRTAYDTEITGLDVAGGELPPGVMIRKSATPASKGGTSSLAGGGGGGAGGGAAISSFFDIWTELSTDGGVVWWRATNGSCRMDLHRIAEAHAYTNNLLPPPLSDYASRQHAKYGTAYVVTNVFHRAFTGHFTPPPVGGTNTHTFGSTVEFDLSTDGGLTFTHASAPATVTVTIIARTGDDGVTVYYDTEMTQLDVSGGGLPLGIEIRESPTKQSLGRTTSSGGGGGGGGGGYQIDSFFDVYTELTTGTSFWWPTTTGPAEVMLEPEAVLVTSVTITGIQQLAGPPPQVKISYKDGSGSQFVLLKSTSVTNRLSGWSRMATNPTTPGEFILPVLPGEDTAFYSIKSE